MKTAWNPALLADAPDRFGGGPGLRYQSLPMAQER
jgi:hypothetical protein